MSPEVPPKPPADPAKTPAGDRIAKVLSRAGAASRRDAERMIAEGRVAVNGKVIDSPALNVTAKDRITLDGKPLARAEPPRLWLYHKPAGLVTSAKDEKGRPTVFDSLPPEMPRVMSVGRLDLSSEGLLILTNDGEVKRKLELPSTGWLRRYRVRINGSVSEEALETLRRGITVDGLAYLPMDVVFDRQQGANAWLTIALREGKNREIRRAMDTLGVAVNRLIRVSYGPFQLGNIVAGAVEEVKGKVVRHTLGLPAEPEAEPKGRRPRRDGEGRRATGEATGKSFGKPGAKPAVRRGAGPGDFARSPRAAAAEGRPGVRRDEPGKGPKPGASARPAGGDSRDRSGPGRPKSPKPPKRRG